METPLDQLVANLRNLNTSDDLLCETAQELLENAEIRAIKPLFVRLSEKTDCPWVRAALITSLGGIVSVAEIKHEETESLLLDVLKSNSEADETKSAAILALEFLESKQAIEILLRIIESGHADLLYSSVVALGKIGDARAVEALKKALKSSSPLVPQAAAKSLGDLGPQAQQALSALHELLRRGNQAERRYAQEAINKIASVGT